MRPPLRSTAAPHPILAAALAIVVSAAVAGCSGGGEPPAAGIGGLTLPPQTVDFPAATLKPRTTPPPPSTVPPATTGGAGTTAPPTTSDIPASSGPTTTEVILALCDLNSVIADIGQAEEGYTFGDLHCSGPWATVVARALDPNISTDELIVMGADEGRWSVLEGGGDTSCTSAGVPPDRFTDLSCGRWE